MIEYNLVSSTAASSFTNSVPIDLADMKGYCIDIDVSGSDVTGDFTLEGRTRPTAAWVTITGSTQSITTSQSVLYDVTAAEYRYVRLAFDYTSGSGNIVAYATVKQNFVSGT